MAFQSLFFSFVFLRGCRGAPPATNVLSYAGAAPQRTAAPVQVMVHSPAAAPPAGPSTTVNFAAPPVICARDSHHTAPQPHNIARPSLALFRTRSTAAR